MENPRASALHRLETLAARPDGRRITPKFAADPSRAGNFTVSAEGIMLDYAKTAIDGEVRQALLALAAAADVEGFLKRFFAGEAVNVSENRGAMHMALRAPADAGYRVAVGSRIEDASAMASGERDRMEAFVRGVHEGRIRAADGSPFRSVLHIGIGGSDLGPRLAVEALTRLEGPRLPVSFLANVDGHAFPPAVAGLDPKHTLVLVVSKSFTTAETALNAEAARAWLAAGAGEGAVGAQMAALSANLKATAAFGIPPERVFGFGDWVGGRFSLWSPVGLSIALASGWDKFAEMLAGAAAMDAHVRSTPVAANLAATLALVDYWHSRVLGCATRCLLPYDERLRLLAAWMQQGEMESNGKGVHLDGSPVAGTTAPVIFGTAGTDAQHSFMQMVHQGRQIVPVTFLLAAREDHDRPAAHLMLAANAFAQAEALMRGRAEEEVRAAMARAGAGAADIDRVAPHRVFTGERPSVTLLYSRLDPATIGRLLALFEHEIAIEGALWGIDSFDQWGVELGKELARAIQPELSPGAAAGAHDGSTSALIARFRALRETP